MKDSFDAFKSVIIVRQKELREELNSLMLVAGNVGNPNATNKQKMTEICKRIVEISSALEDILVGDARPVWLGKIKSNSQEYLSRHNPTNFQKILLYYHDLSSHDWNFNTVENGVDFDSIYQKYKQESKLPELWNELVVLLKKLIEECGDELQTKTLEDLKKLLLTVERNRNGSSDAVRSTLFILWNFLRESVFDLFPAIKISNSAVKTIREIGEVIKSAKDVNQDIEDRVRQCCNDSFKYKVNYCSNKIIEHKSILPSEVDEHYLDTKA